MSNVLITGTSNSFGELAAFGPESPYRRSSEEFDANISTLNSDAIVRVATDRLALVHTLLGGNAHLIMDARADVDFEAFEQTMRTALDWWT